tara:strand:- start:37 stop:192 length:156 start_codon:yes stop_codon:yes gene_type:complete
MICSQESADINSKLLQKIKERKYYKNKRKKLAECAQALESQSEFDKASEEI